MKTINGVFIICSIILFYSCNKESDKTELSEPIELRSDFSANEFKNAIIGEWKSVFENPEYENVIYLEFDDQNNSRIILKKDDIEKKYSGNYVVTFMREPAEGNTTLAKIVISSSEKNVELSRVCFDLHNGVHDARDPFGFLLRIYDPPYGVLEKVEK
jgi:hypothetical protein